MDAVSCDNMIVKRSVFILCLTISSTSLVLISNNLDKISLAAPSTLTSWDDLGPYEALLGANYDHVMKTPPKSSDPSFSAMSLRIASVWESE